MSEVSQVPSPLVSVCIPVYNAMPYLPATMAAVLGQRGVDLEVVVRDNASTDGSTDYLRSLADDRLRIEYGTTMVSQAENFRRVTALTRGRYVKLVCADDLISPDGCARQVAILETHRGLALAASRRDIIDGAGRPIARARGLRGLVGRRTGHQVVRKMLWLGHNVIGEPGSAMFRRVDYDSVGGWDGRRPFPMDIDLWLRLLRLGDLHGCGEVQAAFRVAPTSLSGNRTRSQFDQYRDFADEVAQDRYWRVPAWLRWWSRPMMVAVWWFRNLRQLPAVGHRFPAVGHKLPTADHTFTVDGSAPPSPTR